MSKVSTYNISMLMDQTRKIAADYRKATGQALPVTVELARFDAFNMLKLAEPKEFSEGVDAVGKNDKKDYKFQIKGRVLFGKGKSRRMIGQLSWQGDWTHVLVVLYDAEYEPLEILEAERTVLADATSTDKPNKRGSMTVAKFRAIGKSIWSVQEENPESKTAEKETDLQETSE